MLDISKMAEEQLKTLKSNAKEALEKYQEDSIGNCTYGYQILRYAKAGILKIELEDNK